MPFKHNVNPFNRHLFKISTKLNKEIVICISSPINADFSHKLSKVNLDFNVMLVKRFKAGCLSYYTINKTIDLIWPFDYSYLLLSFNTKVIQVFWRLSWQMYYKCKCISSLFFKIFSNLVQTFFFIKAWKFTTIF